MEPRLNPVWFRLYHIAGRETVNAYIQECENLTETLFHFNFHTSSFDKRLMS